MSGQSPTKRLLIVTDAWLPQTNGVVTTWQQIVSRLPGFGIEPFVIEPAQFRTMPMPGYGEIKLAINPWKLGQMAVEVDPDAVHIVTEGPLGVAARQWCLSTNRPFTTSVHTKFPEYIADRSPLSPSAGYAFLRWFHRHATTVLAMSPSHAEELGSRGINNISVWLGGVDTQRFHPASHTRRPRPQLLYVGRVAIEKNLRDFLQLDIEADKVIVGDGPARVSLQKEFPDAQWMGYQFGDALTQAYAQADVLVFPSKTDTYGLVMLEANACGTPVAAYNVTGPKDVIRHGVNGYLDSNIKQAIFGALKLSRENCRQFAMTRNWDATTAQFTSYITGGQDQRAMLATGNALNRFVEARLP